MSTPSLALNQPVAVDSFGATRSFPYNFELEVGFGAAAGYTRVAAIGNNASIDTGSVPEDIWTPGGIYNWSTTAVPLEIVSTSTSDSAAGTGSRTISITGLDTGYNQITETVTMNGITPVPLVNQFFRINTARNITCGTGQVNAGDISIRDVAGGTIRAQLPSGYGITRMAAFTVPVGRTLQVTSIIGCTVKNGGGVLHYWTMAAMIRSPLGAIVAPLELGFDDIPYRHDSLPGIILPEKTDFWLRVNNVSTNGLSVIGGFLGIMKRTD